MISGSEVKMDESAMTGESDHLRKMPFDRLPGSNTMGNMTSSLQGGEAKKKVNPFLVSGTKVVDGTGVMLVLTVGENT